MAPLKKLARLAVVLVAAAALAALLLDRGIVRFNYPGLRTYPVQGVDVSHHQGRIDWLRLKGPKVQFAYIKASEGATFRDPKFVSNWTGATAAGVVPGAYHYFTLCKPGAEQASNFLGALAGVAGIGLPPAVDLEFGGNCGERPAPARFEAELDAFTALVRDEAGCEPVLYVTREFYRAYVAGRFPGRRLWVRNIFASPTLEHGGEWLLWQFANRGRMPGVSTFIDLNVFNGPVAEFQRFRCLPPA